MGEKGRSQLQRDMRESIYATIAGATRLYWETRTPILQGFRRATCVLLTCTRPVPRLC